MPRLTAEALAAHDRGSGGISSSSSSSSASHVTGTDCSSDSTGSAFVSSDSDGLGPPMSEFESHKQLTARVRAAQVHREQRPARARAHQVRQAQWKHTHWLRKAWRVAEVRVALAQDMVVCSSCGGSGASTMSYSTYWCEKLHRMAVSRVERLGDGQIMYLEVGDWVQITVPGGGTVVTRIYVIFDPPTPAAAPPGPGAAPPAAAAAAAAAAAVLNQQSVRPVCTIVVGRYNCDQPTGYKLGPGAKIGRVHKVGRGPRKSLIVAGGVLGLGSGGNVRRKGDGGCHTRADGVRVGVPPYRRGAIDWGRGR